MRALLFLLLVGAGCVSDYLYDFDGDGWQDADDCNASNAAVYPGAPDPIDAELRDDNCDGIDGVDADGDSFAANEDAASPDCNDGDATVHAGAAEAEDDRDDDCDGLIDEGLPGYDDDGDGYSEDDGDCDDGNTLLHPGDADGDGHDTCTGADCDDGRPTRHPGAPETCDGLDDDCDGAVPDPEVDRDGDGASACLGDCDDLDPTRGVGDADGDGQSTCDAPPDCDDADPAVVATDADGDGASDCAGDCDDTRAEVGPGLPEICDGLDQDCDGVLPPGENDADVDGEPSCLDCDDGDAALQHLDLDGDGFSACAGDCDDFDLSRRPFVADPFGDGVDADCDGIDGVDLDGDGAAQGPDCDDLDPAMGPWDADGDGASPCDGDCGDGDPALGPADLDGDGFSTCEGDCDDGEPLRNPSRSELCNLIDDDCDGIQPPDEVDGDADGDPACADCDDSSPGETSLDADGDGRSSCAGDCDDGDASFVPLGADAWGDGLDTNCDGVDGADADGDGAPAGLDCDDGEPQRNLADLDGDGSSTCAGDCDDQDVSANLDDLDADGFATCEGDCDDAEPASNPGRVELCDLIDDDCDGVAGPGEWDGDGDLDPACSDCDDTDPTLTTADADGDGFSSCAGDCDDTTSARAPLLSDSWGDGIDSDCSGIDGTDQDGDGAPAGLDCDDASALLDLDDDDGDGATSCGGDCDDGDPLLNVGDVDGDGFSPCEGDCTDLDGAVSPGETEICDLVDDDCDGLQGPSEWDADLDLDAACADCDDNDASLRATDGDGDGVSTCALDCDDSRIDVAPGLPDPLGDGLDADCSGQDGVDLDADGSPLGIDCNDSDATLHWGDIDGDGASPCGGDCDDGDATMGTWDDDGDGWSSCLGDCDDGQASANPAATELCDLIDNDCDGTQPADEVDGDGDGAAACVDCADADPAIDGLDGDGDGYSECLGDCDDADLGIGPLSMDPVGDGIDANCDGIDGVDVDGDGWPSIASLGSDCDDLNPDVRPDATEIANSGLDENCDGVEGIDADGDGFVSLATGGGDCDDGAPLTWPGAPDTYGDGADQDCDGADGIDEDGDGWANAASLGDDCDDADPLVYPGLWEDRLATTDDNCDGVVGATWWTFGGTVTNMTYQGMKSVGRCDVDGDFVPDLIVAEANGTYQASTADSNGVVHIHWGPLSGSRTAAQRGAYMEGSSDFGYDARCLGDAGGDHADDFVILESWGDGWDRFDGPIEVPRIEGSADRIYRGPLAPQWSALASFHFLPDMDGDGRTDALICDSDSTSTGPWTCRLHTDGWLDAQPTDAGTASFATAADGAIAAGDWNGDGQMDMAIGANPSSSSASVFVYAGPLVGPHEAGNAVAEILAPISPTSWLLASAPTAAGPDALVAYSSGGAHLISIFDGPVVGTRSMASAPVSWSPGALMSLDACDLDGDGEGNLVWTANTGDYLSSIWTTGSVTRGGLFEPGLPGRVSSLYQGQVYPYLTNATPTALHCAEDLDGGGWPDLVADGRITWVLPNPMDGVCWSEDRDGDGFGGCADCDDEDAARHPGSVETADDHIDNDCDLDDGTDSDGDGYRNAATGGGDCADGDAARHPGAVDLAGDGIDQDCDGADDWDTDGDGWNAAAAGGPDCADGDALIHPNTTDGCEDGVDQDCSGSDAACPAPVLHPTGSLTVSGVFEYTDYPFAIGDWNGDGLDDLAAMMVGYSSSGSAVRVFYGPFVAPRTASLADATLTAGSILGFEGSLASGDVNGDGRDDLVVGNSRGVTIGNAGTVHVLTAPPSGSAVISTLGLTFTGEGVGDEFGASVVVGDWDADGQEDIAVGAPWHDGCGTQCGRVYVLPGPTSTSSPMSNGFPGIDGQDAWEGFGSRLWNLGDLGGDPADDLLVETLYRGYAFPDDFGVWALVTDVPTAPGDVGVESAFWPGGPSDAAGVGDWNGDGAPDLAMWWGPSSSRDVRVFGGPFSGAQDGTGWITRFTTGLYIAAGGGLTRVQDLDGDGLDELLIGDPEAGSSYSSPCGAAFLAWGGTTGSVVLHTTTDRWQGSTCSVPYTDLGMDVAAAGDLTGDGTPDLVLVDAGSSSPLDGLRIVSSP